MSDVKREDKAPMRGGKGRPTKENFYVRLMAPDGKPAFFNATAYIGKEMPYDKPIDTCAMSVADGVVAFSGLHLTKQTSQRIAASTILIPKGPLARLQKRAKELELKDNEVVVEMDNQFYHLTYSGDDSGLITLETADDQSDFTFDLPPRGVQISLYLKSPKVPYTIAVSYIGHLGKPGTPETILRAAAFIVNFISGLVEFSKLSGIESAKVPAAPHKFAARPPARKSEDKVIFELTVNMVTTDFQPVKSGTVIAEIDLDHANPSSGHLLYHFTPDKEIEDIFPEYREMVVAAITSTLQKDLGEELVEITFNIVLGEVDAGTLDRLRGALQHLLAIDVSPLLFQVHVVAEPAPVA